MVAQHGYANKWVNNIMQFTRESNAIPEGKSMLDKKNGYKSRKTVSGAQHAWETIIATATTTTAKKKKHYKTQ